MLNSETGDSSTSRVAMGKGSLGSYLQMAVVSDGKMKYKVCPANSGKNSVSCLASTSRP